MKLSKMDLADGTCTDLVQFTQWCDIIKKAKKQEMLITLFLEVKKGRKLTHLEEMVIGMRLC